MKFLEIKVNQIKNKVYTFNNQLDVAEERISELREMSEENIQNKPRQSDGKYKKDKNIRGSY